MLVRGRQSPLQAREILRDGLVAFDACDRSARLPERIAPPALSTQPLLAETPEPYANQASLRLKALKDEDKLVSERGLIGKGRKQSLNHRYLSPVSFFLCSECGLLVFTFHFVNTPACHSICVRCVN